MSYASIRIGALTVKVVAVHACSDYEGAHYITTKYGLPYFTNPTIRSLGPGRLIRRTSANPAAFIQSVYSASL